MSTMPVCQDADGQHCIASERTCLDSDIHRPPPQPSAVIGVHVSTLHLAASMVGQLRRQPVVVLGPCAACPPYADICRRLGLAWRHVFRWLQSSVSGLMIGALMLLLISAAAH